MIVHIDRLKLNPDNPRICSEFMEDKTLESLLTFSNMLKLRPLLVRDDGMVIGGNQRLTALRRIKAMDAAQLREYMEEQTKFRLLSKEEQQGVVDLWLRWQKVQLVPVRPLSDCTDAEIAKILLLDNVHYGEDNPQIIREEYTIDQLEDWMGSVDQSLWELDSTINDNDVQKAESKTYKFSCGSVECRLTEDEYTHLCTLMDDYTAEHADDAKGFITALISPLVH